MKMLARDRKNRVQTPEELLADLALVEKGDMPTKPQGHAARPKKKRRGKGPVIATGETKRPWWRIFWPFGK